MGIVAMEESDLRINFTGIAHDHEGPHSGCDIDEAGSDKLCSTIAILRRHPLYDGLILVKKFRRCLDGYVLEFPSMEASDLKELKENKNSDCLHRKLTVRYLDGDDPWLESSALMASMLSNKASNSNDMGSLSEPNNIQSIEASSRENSNNNLLGPEYPSQVDDLGQTCEFVHVPTNGLLDRLKNFTESGIAIDSKVYAYAMGLKTSERLLTTTSMREVYETPGV